jgi:hypothetical protein
MNDFLNRQPPLTEEATRWMKKLRDLYTTIQDVPWPEALGESHLEKDRLTDVLNKLNQFRAYANQNKIFSNDPIEWSLALSDYEMILVIAGQDPEMWYEYAPVLNSPAEPQPHN